MRIDVCGTEYFAYQYMDKLISIIVPIYNMGPYLERCLDSIVNQTYKNLEIILVDDGSTDGSGAICDRYAEKDGRIIVIHKKNEGPSDARNKGINLAKGDFIAFVDGDDYIAPDMYEALYKYMKGDVGISCCGTCNIGLRDKKVANKTKGAVAYRTEEALEELLKGELLCFSACDKLFRRNIIGNIRFPKGRLCEDLPFTYQVIKRSNKVVNIGEVKYFYCYREDSRSKAAFSKRRMDYIHFTRDIYRDIRNSYPRLTKVAEYRYFDNITWIIMEIENAFDREAYKNELRRLKKVLRHMAVRIVTNPYMGREQKAVCLKAMR